MKDGGSRRREEGRFSASEIAPGSIRFERVVASAEVSDAILSELGVMDEYVHGTAEPGRRSRWAPWRKRDG